MTMCCGTSSGPELLADDARASLTSALRAARDASWRQTGVSGMSQRDGEGADVIPVDASMDVAGDH